MRYVFIILLAVHALIHVLGFIKAFSIIEVSQLSESISKNLGMLFLFAAILFMAALILFYMKNEFWYVLAFLAILVSQFLIISQWQDAKFGTIINLVILIAVIVSFASWNFENNFKHDRLEANSKSNRSNELLSEEDMEKLPLPVQRYLTYVGVVGKPKVANMSLLFEGEMRGKDQDWFYFTSEQYNGFEHPTRLFFMKAHVKYLPTTGYHYYKENVATMNIKLLSLFSIVKVEAPELFPAETVTFFNDLCLFAPAALIDDKIRWEPIDDLSVKAYFTNLGNTISAILYFNEKGQLINFVSEDRYSIDDMKKYRFSTPVSNYKNFNGYMLPAYGEAIWHYPDGEFTYGKFNLKQINYNLNYTK